MGIQYDIDFPSEIPTFTQLREFLAKRGQKLGMRMIDGQLAFPDEEPPPSWNEVRVALAKEMITLRRTTTGVSLLAWGNADLAMQKSWREITWGFAALGNGQIRDEGNLISPADFARAHHLESSPGDNSIA